jgi:hypothetical protein
MNIFQNWITIPQLSDRVSGFENDMRLKMAMQNV